MALVKAQNPTFVELLETNDHETNEYSKNTQNFYVFLSLGS